MKQNFLFIFCILYLSVCPSSYAQNYWGEGHVFDLNQPGEEPLSPKKVVEFPDPPEINRSVQDSIPYQVEGKSLNTSNKVLEMNAVTKRIPQGATMDIVLNNYLDAKKSKEGDPFSARIKTDVLVDNDILIPAGTVIRGRVSKVKKPRFFSKSGSILLDFDHVVTPLGKEIMLDIDLSESNEVNKKGALVSGGGYLDAVKESARSGYNTTKTITKGAYDLGMSAGKVPVVVTTPVGASVGALAGTTIFATKSSIAIFKKGGNPIVYPGDTMELRLSKDLDIPVN